MNRRITAGLIVLSAVAAVRADEVVPLRLNLTAGQAWAFDNTQSTDSKNRATLNGQTQPFTTKTRQHRTGQVQVLAVADGAPTALRVSFDKACETANDFNGTPNTVPYPYAGATVTVTRGPDGRVTDDFTGQADPDTAAELHGLLDADAVVMPNHPVAIGEEWPGDNATVARVMQLTGQDRGGMTLKLLSIKTVDGRPTAEVKVSFAVMKAQGPMNGKVIAQGTQLVDIATGHGIKADFAGSVDITGQQQAPQPGPDGQPMKYDIQGQGTLSISSTAAFTGGAQPGAMGGGMAGGNAPMPGGMNSGMNGGINGGGNVPGAFPPMPGGDQPAVPSGGAFGGVYSDDKLKVDFHSTADGFEGTFVMGGQTFPARAAPAGQPGRVSGSFMAGGRAFPFTAALDGDTLTLISGATTYHLKKAAVNPLDGGPANPLAPHSDAGGRVGERRRVAIAGVSKTEPNRFENPRTTAGQEGF